jgi:CRP-like cAMP-binding protein
VYKTLLAHIHKTSPDYSEEYFNNLIKVMRIKEIDKKTVYLKEGDVCKESAWIYKGCFKYYRTNSKGEEYITQFAMDEYWIGDISSLLEHTPAKMTIEALEDSTIMTMARDDFNKLMFDCPGFSEFTRRKRAKAYDSALEHVVDINESAEIRYEKLLDRYPTISQRVALYQVASYLGITRESLSRIRKNSR